MAELTVVRGNGAALPSLPLLYGATDRLTLLCYGWLKQNIVSGFLFALLSF
jgi:hypothetical protein